MTHGEFCALALEYGFKRVYFLAPERYELGENPHHLVADVKAEFPFASSVAALVFPYAPFPEGERIPPYYLASNKAYHGMKALLKKLSELGIRAEKAEIPIRPALLNANIGAALRTGFLSIAPFGTRIVLMSIAVEGLEPLEYAFSESTACSVCRKCIGACPAKAISESGVDFSLCHRAFMETAMHPDTIRDCQSTYIGCEVCQRCCPMNAKLPISEPSSDVREAFDTERLIRGDASAARALVGKNMTSNGKLTAEAIAFAARDGEFYKLILEQEDSQFEAVRDAVRYAKTKFNHKQG
ncbi:MAG: hypothetical protein IKZ82_12050 [Clostridia bacterium]|nr:hypothetical protein [Clostridia bacterium]